MPIVIKEVIVKTTVESKTSQGWQPPQQMVEAMKREILSELTEESRTQRGRKERKDR